MSERETLVLRQGDPDPGAFVDDGRGMGVWKGPHSWITRHGGATVHWSIGKPVRIEGALTPGGTQDVETVSPMDHGTWRRRSPDEPGAWIHGRVEIGADGVAFTDEPHAAFVPFPIEDPPSLMADVCRDADFLSRLRDIGFAYAAYASLCNTEYRKDASRRRWSCTWRSAGAYVADMRNVGEAYLDFYLQDMVLADGRWPTPEEREALMAEVVAHYARMGWRQVGEDEARSDHEVALAALEACEAAGEGPCPEWAKAYPERNPVGVHDRVIMAARSGRMAEEEFAILMENLAHEL